jgi:hypothetical protein
MKIKYKGIYKIQEDLMENYEEKIYIEDVEDLDILFSNQKEKTKKNTNEQVVAILNLNNNSLKEFFNNFNNNILIKYIDIIFSLFAINKT